jgi:hypothetical protein
MIYICIDNCSKVKYLSIFDTYFDKCLHLKLNIYTCFTHMKSKLM